MSRAAGRRFRKRVRNVGSACSGRQVVDLHVLRRSRESVLGLQHPIPSVGEQSERDIRRIHVRVVERRPLHSDRLFLNGAPLDHRLADSHVPDKKSERGRRDSNLIEQLPVLCVRGVIRAAVTPCPSIRHCQVLFGGSGTVLIP